MKNNAENNGKWIEAFRKSLENSEVEMPGGMQERIFGRRSTGPAWALALCALAAAIVLLIYPRDSGVSDFRNQYMAAAVDSASEHKPYVCEEIKTGNIPAVIMPIEENANRPVRKRPSGVYEPGPAVSHALGAADESVHGKAAKSESVMKRSAVLRSSITEGIITERNRPSGWKRLSDGKWSVSLSFETSSSADVSIGRESGSETASMADVQDVSESYYIYFRNGVPHIIPPSYDYDHLQPLSFGLGIQKTIGEGWSLGSGITYSLLLARVTENGSEHMTQSLNYIGIPLRIRRSFWSRKNYMAYAGAGFSAAYCIYGKRGSEKLSLNKIQYSLDSALGFEYRLYGPLGLYMETGLSYRFRQNLPVETIWQKNKFGMILQIGVNLSY
ncbi:MAG: PorT family protein [Bacteroidales bacterium]|jgi:hypothetical protein|nr:PorT family protein [Bacteroidales bacterium]